MPLGEFEQVVLFALARLDGEGHGPAIIDEIEARAGRHVSPGALYTVLDRLETKGLVESWIGDSTPDRGGRRRKVYRLLPGGARELRASYESLRRMASGALARLDRLAGEEP
jgi:DNA-binding PadR family transcriptional regulator